MMYVQRTSPIGHYSVRDVYLHLMSCSIQCTIIRVLLFVPHVYMYKCSVCVCVCVLDLCMLWIGCMI